VDLWFSGTWHVSSSFSIVSSFISYDGKDKIGQWEPDITIGVTRSFSLSAGDPSSVLVTKKYELKFTTQKGYFSSLGNTGGMEWREDTYASSEKIFYL